MNIGVSDFTQSPWFLPLVVWTLVWKGVALWKAARKGDKPWYIALLVINLVGLLEIVYIFYFSKRPTKPAAEVSGTGNVV